MTELIYIGLKWTDKEAVAVSKVIATGVLKKLEYLNLSHNQIGDAGVTALAEAAGEGHAAAAQDTLPREQPDWRCRRDGAGGGGGEWTLPQLRTLWLNGNSTISQQAQDALKAALPDCNVFF